MKRKPTKKMMLHRETLRRLEPANLLQIHGGLTAHASCVVVCTDACTATVCSVCCP